MVRGWGAGFNLSAITDAHRNLCSYFQGEATAAKSANIATAGTQDFTEQTAFVSVKDTEQFTESEAPRSGYFTAKKKVTVFSETKISHLGDLKDCFPYAPPRHNNAKNCVFSVLRLCLLAQILLSQGLLIQRLFLLKLHFPCPWGLDKITSVGTNVLSNALE